MNVESPRAVRRRLVADMPRRERSNECLGASVGTGAAHEQCNGRWGMGRLANRPLCGCSCHEERR